MRRASWLILLTAVLAVVPATAELTPEQTTAVRGFIAQFSARDYKTRQNAVERLVEMGPDVWALVFATHAATEDAEVKVRCEMVMRRLKNDERYELVFDGKGNLTSWHKLNFDASRVTIDVKKRPLSEVLAAFTRQTGNTFAEEKQQRRGLLAKLAGKHRGPRVSLKVKDMPFWDALDTLCKENNLTMKQDWRGSLQFTPGRKADGGGARFRVSTGPAVLMVTQASMTRHLNLSEGKTRRTLNYSLSGQCENRLTVVETRCWLSELVADDGTALEIPAGMRKPEREQEGLRHYHGTNRGRISASFHIQEPPKDMKKLAKVSGLLRLTYVANDITVTIPDIALPGEKTVVADYGDITFKKLEVKGNQSVVHVEGNIAATAMKPWNFSSGFDPEQRRYGVFLVDPKGKRHRSRGHSVSGGDGGFKASFDFFVLPAEGWSLIFVSPKRVLDREYPFKLTDLPVP